MSADIEFRPATDGRALPLHKREPLQVDYRRLGELAKELGLGSGSIAWLAIRELQAYRHSAQAYRAALVELGALYPVPTQNHAVTSL